MCKTLILIFFFFLNLPPPPPPQHTTSYHFFHWNNFCLPCVWRQRRPNHRPCTADQRSLSWWGGRWSTQRWGRSGRAPPLLQTPAAAPAPCPCPSPRSATHSMMPTWRTPRPTEHTDRNTKRIQALWHFIHYFSVFALTYSSPLFFIF